MQGVLPIHALRVIHGDIKPDDFLCTRDCRLKIADLGSCQVEDGIQRVGGDYGLAPPEVCLYGKQPTMAGDIWASGLCYHSFLTGDLPVCPSQNESLGKPEMGPTSWTNAAEFCYQDQALLAGLLEVNGKRCDSRWP